MQGATYMYSTADLHTNLVIFFGGGVDGGLVWAIPGSTQELHSGIILGIQKPYRMLG